MIQSILVPLDGSTFGEHALPWAITAARHTGAAVHLVHVHAPLKSVYLEGAAFLDETVEDDIKAQQKAYLQGVQSRVKSILGDAEVTARFLEGDIAESIADEALSRRADLVVMTTHGRGPIGRFWLGSVADGLIRKMPMPLLLVQPKETTADLAEPVKLARILIPLDGADLAEQVLAPATALGKLTNAEYLLVRIIKPVLPINYPVEPGAGTQVTAGALAQAEAIQERMQQNAQLYLDRISDQLREDNLKVQTRVDIEQQPAIAILGEVDKNDVDLIAIATHGRRGLSRLFLGSVADKLIRGTKVPVLVYRPSE